MASSAGSAGPIAGAGRRLLRVGDRRLGGRRSSVSGEGRAGHGSMMPRSGSTAAVDRQVSSARRGSATSRAIATSPAGPSRARHPEDDVVRAGGHEPPGGLEGRRSLGGVAPAGSWPPNAKPSRIAAKGVHLAQDRRAALARTRRTPSFQADGRTQPSASSAAIRRPRGRWPPSQIGSPPGLVGGGRLRAPRSGYQGSSRLTPGATDAFVEASARRTLTADSEPGDALADRRQRDPERRRARLRASRRRARG